MSYPRLALLLPGLLVLTGCLPDTQEPAAPTPPAVAVMTLGKALFNDTALSSEGNQSCGTCHDAATAFTDPDKTLPVSKGSIHSRLGTRNTPSASYAMFAPTLHPTLEDGEILWVGGLFLDGRADSLEEQATKPFFNPKEMNLADNADLLMKLRGSPNAAAFKAVYGEHALDDGRADQVLAQVAEAIAAFERSPEVNPFSSKYDAYLQRKVNLSPQELEGLSLFVRADKGNCAACHVLDRGPNGAPPVFTDFTYDNIGVPHNAAITPEDADGLFTTDRTAGDPNRGKLRGKFKVASLRNVAKTAPYMHNGIFTELKTVVEFYNTRDTDPDRWAAFGAQEVPENVNHSELGNLGLNDREIDAIVAFLQTLSDGYTP